ncbi:MAG: M1 family metallopeptidase [Micromonosporaceae bacterium]|nr:M1 family metallopeptidase [Micromonosporaceae bacterium]
MTARRPDRRVLAAGALATAGLLLAACVPATQVRVPSPTPPAASPSPSRTPHFAPGAARSDDRLFPELGDGGYDATHYAITVGYTSSGKAITGDAVVTATATQDLSNFALDLRALTVSSVTVDGRPARFSRAGDKLVVTPATGIPLGATFATHIVYGGVPKTYEAPGLGTEGFHSYAGQQAIAQGEPHVAASWYPVDDRPGDKATYDIAITAPVADVALAGGVLTAKTPASGGRQTWHWTESAPMASYLAFVAIGRYRLHTSTHNGRPVLVAVASSLPTSVDRVLAQTPRITDFLASQFGPYPFDAEGGIVHDDPVFGFALENQTRPVYSAAFFRNTSTSYQTSVIAHELAHQWYGDSVSLAQWQDIWLNEGFATYAMWLWTEHQGGASPLQTFTQLYNSGKLPKEAPGRLDRRHIFDNTPYNRGAATLEALRISIGDAAFFQTIRAWAAQHRYGNGTTDEFIALAAQISGKNLVPLFTAWLDTATRPAFPKRLPG